jgi:predicted transcriptional regulator YdeE
MQPGMQQGAKYCYGMNQSSKEKQGIDHNIAYRNALKANKAAVVKYSTLKLSSGEWPALGK